MIVTAVQARVASRLAERSPDGEVAIKPEPEPDGAVMMAIRKGDGWAKFRVGRSGATRPDRSES